MHREACDILAAFKIEARIWLLTILQLLRICTNTTMQLHTTSISVYVLVGLCTSQNSGVQSIVQSHIKTNSTTTVVTSKQTSTKRMNYFDLLLLYITRILLWCCLLEVLSNKWDFEEGYLSHHKHVLFQ